jgi:hypothetical protein
VGQIDDAGFVVDAEKSAGDLEHVRTAGY